MKKILFIFSLFVSAYCFGQDDAPTNSFLISGVVKKEVTVRAKDLKNYTVHKIKDIIITNHLGEQKSEQKNLKGILLKEVLDTAKIDEDSPKKLSEFYFKCIAADGYTVIYSWNELYNSETGNNTYIIIEKSVEPLSEMKESILMLCTTDFKTGRRFLKRLKNIVIMR